MKTFIFSLISILIFSAAAAQKVDYFNADFNGSCVNLSWSVSGTNLAFVNVTKSTDGKTFYSIFRGLYSMTTIQDCNDIGGVVYYRLLVDGVAESPVRVINTSNVPTLSFTINGRTFKARQPFDKNQRFVVLLMEQAGRIAYRIPAEDGDTLSPLIIDSGVYLLRIIQGDKTETIKTAF